MFKGKTQVKLKLTLVKRIVPLQMTLSLLGLMLTNVAVSGAADLGEHLKPFPYSDTETLPLAIKRAETNQTQSTTFNYLMVTLPKSHTPTTVIASSLANPTAPKSSTFLHVKKRTSFFFSTLKDVFTPRAKEAIPPRIQKEGSHTPIQHRKAQPLLVLSSPVAMASVNSVVSNPVTLPNIWKDGKRPNPTVREQMVMRLIQTTNPSWDAPSAHILARLIIDSGEAHRIDYRILASLIATESSFRINAVSSTGAKGLGQLKDATAQWLGVKDAFDPIENLNGTAKYLSYLADQFPNDPARAVASYFVGQGNVKREDLNESALQYIMKVQRHLDLLLSWGAN
jgi:hypothetical protein